MKKIFTADFISAVCSRMLRTGAQVALSMITVGAAITDMNWRQIIGVTLTAMLCSVLTSIATGLPEVTSDDTEDDETE